MYGRGRAEELLGRFMQQTDRRVLVATKYMPLPWRLRRSALLEALRASLERLQLAQVDLYQIHWPAPPISIDVWMGALSDAVNMGLTREVGVSNYSALQMLHAQGILARRDINLAANQVEYSLLHRQPERNGIMDACRRLGIRLIAYSPLAKGMLTGKYTPDNPPPGLRSRTYDRDYLARLQPLIGQMVEIGEAHGGKTPAQVALNWTLCKGALPIPGARNAHQAKMNAGAAGWRLEADEIGALDAISAELEQ